MSLSMIICCSCTPETQNFWYCKVLFLGLLRLGPWSTKVKIHLFSYQILNRVFLSENGMLKKKSSQIFCSKHCYSYHTKWLISFTNIPFLKKILRKFAFHAHPSSHFKITERSLEKSAFNVSSLQHTRKLSPSLMEL